MKLLFISLILFITACNYNPEKKELLLDSLNEVDAKNLAIKYDALAGWDTADNFAFVTQELLSKAKVISFIGEITEVLKNDSSFIILVKSSNSDIIAQFHVGTNFV